MPRLETGFLRTRVARRVLLLFVLSALLPVAALSVVAYVQVRRELVRQSRERIEDVAKSAGMSVYERLLFTQSQLELYRSGERAATFQPTAGLRSVTPLSRQEALRGRADLPALNAEDLTDLDRGGAMVRVPSVAGDSSIILVVVPAQGGTANGVLWGEVDRGFLWNSARGYAGLSTTAGFCVLDARLNPLRCDLPDLEGTRARLERLRSERGSRRRLEWIDERGDEYLAGAWEIFLDAAFGAPSWTVVVAERRDEVLAALVAFRTPFLAVVIFGLSVVGLASNVQIRRTLAPLAKLMRATGRIAQRDFGARVDVASGDEFEQLGTSFNAMARNLGVQFEALETIGEIDRAILSELQRDAIVETVLHRAPGVLPGTGVALVLETADVPGTGESYYRAESGDRSSRAEVDTTWLAGLAPDADHAVAGFPDEPRDAESAEAMVGERWETALVVPIQLKTERLGYFMVVHQGAWEYSDADIGRARQIADQVTVALANARLIDDLERLTWGALTALARAIDAKSSWTSGHSERVTALAQRVGRALDLDESTLETLRRAGLLHDIGKIGIPGRVLDKPEALTDEELRVMQSHTWVGARILEPIDALRDVVPVAMYHHEWYNGSGYPEGLAGERIPLLARVLSVADIYDALTSDRPYRDGLAHEVAMEIIEEAAGSQLDPEIVDIFVKINQVAPSSHAT